MKNTAPLIDPFQRRIRKLRVSLLDACNFRCTYCMPLQPEFLPRQNWLSRSELIRIVSILTELGIEQVRLTGGEPTLRRDLVGVAEDLSQLPLQKLGLTTNGFLLKAHLPGLRATRCQHINISLDSFVPETFQKIARREGLNEVISVALIAKDWGFQVKINAVIMRGINDHELADFVRFAEKHDVEVRFLELMAIGEAAPLQKKHFISAREMQAQLAETFTLTPLSAAHDSTSVRYQTAGHGRIGFIAPVTQSFCGTCSRWRLSADGRLKACLMSEEGVSLKNLAANDIHRLCLDTLLKKPRVGRAFTPEHMHTMGG